MDRTKLWAMQQKTSWSSEVENHGIQPSTRRWNLMMMMKVVSAASSRKRLSWTLRLWKRPCQRDPAAASMILHVISTIPHKVKRLAPVMSRESMLWLLSCSQGIWQRWLQRDPIGSHLELFLSEVLSFSEIINYSKINFCHPTTDISHWNEYCISECKMQISWNVHMLVFIHVLWCLLNSAVPGLRVSEYPTETVFTRFHFSVPITRKRL